MLYKVGIVLAVLAWLACLNPYWIIFAGPVFIVGLVMIWLSKVKLKVKLWSSLLPIILWFPSMLAFLYLVQERMTPETFLVPKDFRGQITLIYNEPCGEMVPKVGGRLVYKIPKSGVMILKNEFETGIIDQEFYFVDENWDRLEPIPELTQQDFNEDYTLERNKNEPPRDKVGVFHLGTGGGSSQKNSDYKFHFFAVNSWDSFRVQSGGYPVSDLVDSMLYDCRQQVVSKK